MNPSAEFNYDRPHVRHNPLTGGEILVSPHRAQRPWQGQVEKKPDPLRTPYDESCYLCPGNARANGGSNPEYRGTHVFTNDFPALLPEPGGPSSDESGLFRADAVRGTCRVVCFSPQHDLTIPEMSETDIRDVVDLWARETTELGRSYKWVQVFENKGAVMGCSNPHPHGQIWATDRLPPEPAAEDRNQRAYMESHHEPMLVRYTDEELTRRERVVLENDDWVAVVPYWAVWPFETMVLPKRHVTSLPELTDDERDALAALLKRLTAKYDNLFDTSFPYSMGWHGKPMDGGDYEHWQLHAHFYPPLLRSATVKKFMVGYEMLAGPQRDITPEQAAARLREAADELPRKAAA